MSLARYFASSKKKDLTDLKDLTIFSHFFRIITSRRLLQSEVGDDTKKMREDSSAINFSENDDVFLEGLKYDDCCSNLANCLKNIHEKIK